jgi:hypothetical protein
MAMQPLPRFQFSLRTALLLTPVLAGLVYLHLSPSDHQIVAIMMDSALIASAVTMFVSRKWPITKILTFGLVLWMITYFLSIYLIVKLAKLAFSR